MQYFCILVSKGVHIWEIYANGLKIGLILHQHVI